MAHSVHFHRLDIHQANDGWLSTSGYVAQMNGGGFGRVDGYQNLGSPFTGDTRRRHLRGRIRVWRRLGLVGRRTLAADATCLEACSTTIV